MWSATAPDRHDTARESRSAGVQCGWDRRHRHPQRFLSTGGHEDVDSSPHLRCLPGEVPPRADETRAVELARPFGVSRRFDAPCETRRQTDVR